MLKKTFLYSVILVMTFFAAAGYGAPQTDPKLPNMIGQMMMVGFDGTEVHDNSPIVNLIKKYHIGGVIIQSYRIKDGKRIVRNVENLQQLKKLIADLQNYAVKTGNPKLLIAINQEGGKIDELPAKLGFDLPDNLSQQQLGELNDTAKIYAQAKQQGDLLKSLGINLNLAPVADLNLNPDNPGIGRLQRSFGSDPAEVTRDLTSEIQALKKTGIACTLKHFPGLGSASSNTDYAMADVTNTWSTKELIPYKNLINNRNDCDFIMVTHLINRKLDESGLPASLSKKMVTDLLRKQLHFQKLIITDDMDAKAIRQFTTPADAIKKAVLAGNDIIIYGGTQGYDATEDANLLFKNLLMLAQTDPQARARIIQSYKKILQYKSTKNLS